MDEQPPPTQCHRQGCQRPVEAEITLILTPQNEKKRFWLCLYHYYQAVQVIRGIQAFTGLGITEQQEGGQLI